MIFVALNLIIWICFLEKVNFLEKIEQTIGNLIELLFENKNEVKIEIFILSNFDGRNS